MPGTAKGAPPRSTTEHAPACFAAPEIERCIVSALNTYLHAYLHADLRAGAADAGAARP